MTTLYLSGPMRGVPFFNAPAFETATRRLRELGFVVVSPEEHDRARFLQLGIHLDTEMPDWYEAGDESGLLAAGTSTEELMAWDIEQVENADGIVFLPGWENSLGARTEALAAIDHMTAGTKTYSFHLFDFAEGGFLRPLMARVVVNELATTVEHPTEEVRVVNATTGGAKGQKLARFDLLPPGPLREVAEHYGRGASKYEDRNWERGYDWSLSFAAMQRHAWSFWNGEDDDPECRDSHLAAVVFHAFALMEFRRTHPELDNRPKAHVTEDKP